MEIQTLSASGSGTGGDWNDPAQFNGQNRDLVTEANGGITLLVSNDFGGVISGGISIAAGWNTDAANPVIVKPATPTDGHQGVRGQGAIFETNANIVTGNVGCTSINHLTIEGLTFRMIGTSNQQNLIYLDRTVNFKAQDCFFETTGTHSSRACIVTGGSSTAGASIEFISCAFICEGSAKTGYFNQIVSSIVSFENCTFGGYTTALGGASSVTKCINVVSANNTVSAFGDINPGGDSLNNACDDGTAPTDGTAIQDLSVADGVDFASPSTGDYRPQPGGKLDGAGVDNSAAGYTTDIAGVTRG